MDTFNNQSVSPPANKRSLVALILACLFLITGVFGIINGVMKIAFIFSDPQYYGLSQLAILGKAVSFTSLVDLILGVLSLFVAYGLFKMRRWVLVLLTTVVVAQTLYFIYLLQNGFRGSLLIIFFKIALTIYLWRIKDKFN